jgi:hypothetical protein
LVEAKEVFAALGQLGVTVGLIDAVQGANEEYEPAREGWEQRKEEIVRYCESQIEEITGFGEAFDTD